MARLEMRDRLEDMLCFSVVARTLSFAVAARELGTSASTLSRRIARLEQVLGTALLRRTTRRVALTEAGGVYLERCADVLHRVEEADALVSGLGGEPKGRLRVALPNLFGQLHVAPHVPEFLRRHPRIDLELSFTDRYVDLVREGFDVAVRIGSLPDSSLVVRRLATVRRILVASPRYLQGRRAPTKPADLGPHPSLHFSHFTDGEVWTLCNGEARESVRVRPVLRSDNAEALRLAAVEGSGVAALATFLVGADLEAGRLVRVLAEWALPEVGVFAVHPPGRWIPSKTRAFVGLAAKWLAGEPWEPKRVRAR
ncbi:LysR family transcriptional regulator [Myxococcus stipitatus]|uniref:LysR family transcriptional regulator n=1 Tax=Myxococcus stipitatus TaxID=83455 RepID=UPI001F2D2A2B|nr:LysR family transcriptional regulator [Myxococcus stipitatus]MCE9666807.1 LysR family transcriptional regulator [Myxococcus stipitatus]